MLQLLLYAGAAATRAGKVSPSHIKDIVLDGVSNLRFLSLRWLAVKSIRRVLSSRIASDWNDKAATTSRAVQIMYFEEYSTSG